MDIKISPRTSRDYKIINCSITPDKTNTNKGVKQKALIIEELKQGSCLSIVFRDLGITNPSSRISELKEIGNNIESTLVTATDHTGRIYKQVALYTLKPSDHDRGKL